MMTIFKLYENLKRISIVGIVHDIVLSDSDLIVDLQKDQMLSGKDATGKSIAPSYFSDAYAEMKKKMNNRIEMGTPDLRLTGDFYRGFYLDTDRLIVTSDDPKTPSLIKKYGKHIFGLNENTIRRYRQIFNPNFYAEFMAQLAGE